MLETGSDLVEYPHRRQLSIGESGPRLQAYIPLMDSCIPAARADQIIFNYMETD